MTRKTSLPFAALLVAVALLVGAAGGQGAATPEYDVVLRHGTIVDGSGLPAYRADVGVRDGYVHAIGDLGSATAATDLDVTGLMVAPGFVDPHSHASTSELPVAKSSLLQGVTTEILNPDGGGPVDLRERWALERDGLAINIAAYVGFNSIWEEVVGEDDRRATPDELARMRELVARGMRDGAWGVSSGLEYTPAFFADTDEVIEVVRAASRWRTNYPSHIRNEDAQVLESAAEAIRIGEEAGLAPVITHAKVMGVNWPKTADFLRMLDEANARGTLAMADQYPYLAAQTGLSNLIPKWAQDGGWEAMLARFADPALRARIEAEIHETIPRKYGPASNVYFATKQQTLADVAQAMGVTPGEATMRLLETEGEIGTIYFFGREDVLRQIMRSPWVSVTSDGGATSSTATHPRRYGTQPRVLGRYVREAGVLTWEQAIRKMSAQPATLVGMVDRGFLAAGMAADITVFDPETIIDRATFEQPQQYPEGVRHVLVGGALAVRDGRLTGAQAGRALRRAPSMPSRRISERGDARVHGVVRGEGSALVLGLSVEQRRGERRARGRLQLVDGSRGIVLRSVRLGRLQVAEGWASVTGVGRLTPSGEERAFLVTVDRHDPTVPGDRVGVTVRVDGVLEARGVLVGGADLSGER